MGDYMRRLFILPGRAKKPVNAVLVLILAASFIVKLVLAFTVNIELRSDSMVYDALAKNLLTLGQYSFDGKVTALLSPGYPFFLSLVYYFFSPEQIYVKIIQSLLEIFTGYLFYRVCLSFFRIKYALIAAGIFALLPSNILFSQTILTEPLFGLLSMGLLYYCIREKIDWKIFLIGLLWGAAILTRSSFAASIILLPLFIFLCRKGLFEGYKKTRLLKAAKYSLLFLAGAALLITPWMLRNKAEVGAFTLATQGGFTFWSGSNPGATGTWYHGIEKTSPLFNIANEAERDRAFYKNGLEYALENPHRFLFTGIKKIGYLFSSERMIVIYFMEGEDRNFTSTDVYRLANLPFMALVNIPYFLIMIPGIWGLFLLNRKRFFIYGFILTWAFTVFMFVALARYHYVLIPFFVIGAVNFIINRKNFLQKLTAVQKISAAVITLFFISVWVMEFYLLYK